VVPVSYREKIRVDRSEIIFLNIFFMVLAVFCLAILNSSIGNSPIWTNLGNLVQQLL
jgi:hypothetical protein